MKYKIITYGCQMNKLDSERLAGFLEKMGWKPAEKAEGADLILLNTCSVRKSAEDRVFGQARNFAKLKKKNPRLLIGVTGCMAGRDKDSGLRKKMPYVDLFFLIEDCEKELCKLGAVDKSALDASDGMKNFLNIAPKRNEWWRGWVVVQTGCSRYCTYCVVPRSRGHAKNRPVADILREARQMARTGAKEIILLGQAVNNHPKFARILRGVCEIKGVNRVGFASAHPLYMTDEIIETLKLPKMINFFHLPVQSGNNEILKKMNRGYAREEYLDIVHKIRAVRPDISLATDIIVGFPGQTKKQFADTVSLYKECDFDMSYNAMYSPRSGTVAFKMLKDNVPQAEKRRRWLVLQKLMEQNALRKNKKYLGCEVEVLVDGCKNGKCRGMSREYKRVVFSGDKSLVGEIVKVKIESVKEWELEGERQL